MNKTIDTETLLLKVESHEHRIGIMENLLRDAKQVVCSARALSNGCKSRVSPNSGNYIAKGKGVHREVKSERSRRQTSDLTDRNFIQGI